MFHQASLCSAIDNGEYFNYYTTEKFGKRRKWIVVDKRIYLAMWCMWCSSNYIGTLVCRKVSHPVFHYLMALGQ